MPRQPKFDPSFSITGVVTWNKEGVSKKGNPFYMLKIAGINWFVDEEIYNSCSVGDKVELHGEVDGTKPGSYDANYVFDGVIVLADADSPDFGKVPAFSVNGNGKHEKGAPA